MQICEVILLPSEWWELKIQGKSSVSEDIEKCSLLVNVGETKFYTNSRRKLDNVYHNLKAHGHTLGYRNSSFKHLF